MTQPKNATPAADIARPVFDVGNDAAKRMSDPTVAVAVTVNVSIKNSQRTISLNAPLHEVPLLRRMYRHMSGVVTARADWVPGLRRRARLSHSQLQDELTRLSRLYVLPIENGKRDIMAEVYGATSAERLRALRDKMVEANRLWAELEERAMVDIRASGMRYHRLEAEALIADRLSDKDIEQVVRRLDPAEVAAEEIELGAILDDEKALSPAGVDLAAGAAPAAPKAAGSIAAAFSGVGTPDDDELPTAHDASQDQMLEPAELTEADVLIASLRQDGVAPQDANQAAIIVSSYQGRDRLDRLTAAGFKGKTLASVKKRAVEFDAATATANG